MKYISIGNAEGAKLECGGKQLFEHPTGDRPAGMLVETS